MKRIKQIWVDQEFAQNLKIQSAKANKSIIEYTSAVVDNFKKKKGGGGFNFEFHF